MTVELPSEAEPVKVVRGDCLNVLRAMPDGCVDAVVTDPPYSSGGMYRADRTNFRTDEKYTVTAHRNRRHDFAGDNMDQRSWMRWCGEWLSEAKRVARTAGHLVCFTDWRQLPALTDAVQWAGWVWRGVLAWDKTEAAKGPHPGYFAYQCEFLVWATNGPCERKPTLAEGGQGRMPGCFRKGVSATDKHHQTGKPTDVMRWLSRCCPPGGLVLDPFAGSGTTGIAALLEGRRCLLVEKEAAYAKVARRRVAEALAAREAVPA